jgi:RIO kinase 1
MLCAGVVHGDLSEFNILLAHTPGADGADGVDEPVIRDLHQAGLLSKETVLTGRFERKHADVDMQAVLREIDDARAEDAARRLRMSTTAAS